MGELSYFFTKGLCEEVVAPTVEHWTPNPRVAGSNPVDLTFLLQFNINIIVL